MNTDVEELLRDGMQRFTNEVTAPDGLAQAAGRLHRRRTAVRATAACGGLAVAVAVAVAVTIVAGGARTAAPAAMSPAQQRHAAYVTSRVISALSSQDMVSVEHMSFSGIPNVTWTYGSQYNWVQYWPSVDYRDRVVNGQRLWDFPPQDRGQPATASGTALVGGKLMGAYVTYQNSRYSLSPMTGKSYLPTSACSTTDRLAMGGNPVPGVSWPDFIDATLKCGTASVTGNVQIDGAQTTEITGEPVTVKLSPGYAKTVHEQWATVRWTLFVNPVTYLPVRMYGSTETFGGSAGDQVSAGTTDVQWLPATPANIAKALVTIPPGFQLYTGNPGNQVSGTLPG
jgi:hypothetical protein